MRIFIADSNQDSRLGLQMLFRQEPGMYVTGMAIESEGLLKQVEATRADVLLLDWHLPGASSMEILADIHELEPPPKIVVLSPRPEEEGPALSAGADAFASKNIPPDALLNIVRSFREITVDSTE